MTQREEQLLQMIEENPMISQQELAQKLGITRSSVAVHISNLTRKGVIAGKGYVLRSGNYAAVVGGVNVDICGKSHAPLVAADSNPGSITMSLGGVGRNIAHNLRLMDVDVKLFCAYGDDMNGQRVEASCASLGIDLKQALKLPGENTSTYLYMTDPEGEMALAVSDMGICDRITPAYLNTNLALLRNAQVVVADTNIPKESLEFLAKNSAAPLFIDPVSTKKAEKIRDLLPYIHTLKPNRLEAELLSGIPIRKKEDVEAAVDVLLQQGVKRVFVSMSGDGVYAADGQERIWLPIIPGEMVNTTGCGDAFAAALVWAYMEGLSLKETAQAALAAGSLAMESSETINARMSPDTLRERMGL